MPDAEQQPAEPSLKHLDGATFAVVLAWVERALRGSVPLPRVVADESPEESILRQDRALAPTTREDLREACRQLVRQFVRKPEDDDFYVAALLRLGKGFALGELASDLHQLAAASETFARLPGGQQKTVLATLLDLRAPLPGAFWHHLAERDPARFGIVALSALLRRDALDALAIVPLLPDDEGLADEVYVVLGQHEQASNPKDQGNLIAVAGAVAAISKPRVQSALNEWIQEQPRAEQPKAQAAASSRLEAALVAHAAKQNQPFTLVPRRARLVPVEA